MNVKTANAFGSKGKKEKLKLKAIQKLGIIKSDPGNFLAFLDDSFWIMGGERVGFSYAGSKVRFGKQLSVKDCEYLIRSIEAAMREFKTK